VEITFLTKNEGKQFEGSDFGSKSTLNHLS